MQRSQNTAKERQTPQAETTDGWREHIPGEHLFAPALMTGDPAAPRSQQPGGRDRLTYTGLRWPHLATGTRGHYSKLRQRLNDYADRQAAQIDGNHSDPISRTPNTKKT
jgi:hypothetical protein